MRAYIGALDLILFAALVGHVDDLDAPGSAQKRHGIADRTRRSAASVPAYHNMIQPERRSLNVGNNDDRPPGIEQRGFDDILLDHFGLRLRLPDNGQIEAPRDLAELTFESRIVRHSNPQDRMSALCPKADICLAYGQ